MAEQEKLPRFIRSHDAGRGGNADSQDLPSMPGYVPPEANTSIFKPIITSEEPGRLEHLRRTNNPDNKPVGHFTGRCAHCGSSDLWDDNLAYGCNGCEALLGGN